jgi:hypothetical protein
MCIATVEWRGRTYIGVENVPWAEGGLLLPELERPVWEDDNEVEAAVAGEALPDLPLGEPVAAPVSLWEEVLDIWDNVQVYIPFISTILVLLIAYSLREFVYSE